MGQQLNTRSIHFEEMLLSLSTVIGHTVQARSIDFVVVGRGGEVGGEVCVWGGGGPAGGSGRKCLFNSALNTYFIYGYMASDIWLRTILIVRKKTRCCHIGYCFRLTASVVLYAPIPQTG